jgi:hypothetical protein
MGDHEIFEITSENVSSEGLFCIKNPKNPGFKLKMAWLENRRKEGLKLKVLKVDGVAAGFIEYVPGRAVWRPVSASNFMFIHCLWVYPKKFLQQGLGSLLIQHCIEDAKEQGMDGVATMTSKGSWLSSPEVFKKNGFALVEKKGRFLLMAKKMVECKDPAFRDWDQEAEKYKGLHLVYAPQCPLFAKSLDEMAVTAKKKGYELKVTVLESPEMAQKAPSGYGVYSLLYDGKVLADHYISNTRFTNILEKELS